MILFTLCCSSYNADSNKDRIRGLSTQLRRVIGQWVVVYEKNAIVLGYVADVKNYGILELENTLKFVYDLPFLLPPLERLFISICELTEFAPITATTNVSLTETLRANINAQ